MARPKLDAVIQAIQEMQDAGRPARGANWWEEWKRWLPALVEQCLAKDDPEEGLLWTDAAEHLLHGVGGRIRELREIPARPDAAMTLARVARTLSIWDDPSEKLRPMGTATLARIEMAGNGRTPWPEELVQLALFFAARDARPVAEVLDQLFQRRVMADFGVRYRLLDLAKRAVRAAGEKLLESCGVAGGPQGAASFDRQSFDRLSREVRAGISQAVPGAGPPPSAATTDFLDQAEDQQIVWIADSLDGTINFSAGLPTWCVALAAARWQAATRELVPLCAAVYCPPTGELFYAVADVIAFCERPAGQPARRLAVSQVTNLKRCVLGTHLGTSRPDVTHAFVDKLLGPLCKVCQRILMFGSTQLALCYVAAGWLHAFVTPVTRYWDVLAAKIILDAAAGRAGTGDGRDDFAGQPWDWLRHSVLAACNETLRLQIENFILVLWPEAAQDAEDRPLA